MSNQPDDLTYYVEPASPVEKFFSTAGAWEGDVDWVIGDDRMTVPMVLFSDGQGHGFGVKRETGES